MSHLDKALGIMVGIDNLRKEGMFHLDMQVGMEEILHHTCTAAVVAAVAVAEVVVGVDLLDIRHIWNLRIHCNLAKVHPQHHNMLLWLILRFLQTVRSSNQVFLFHSSLCQYS